MFDVMIDLEPQVLTHISVYKMYADTFQNWICVVLTIENTQLTVQIVYFLSSLDFQQAF